MFFKKEKNDEKKPNLEYVVALLIHAAKIDEKFTEKEEKIINKFLIELGEDEQNIHSIIENSKKIEENSNQMLDFTREIKNMGENEKIKIIETLWRIIFSNKEVDMYESNLMRRLGGLLYIDNKSMGNIKEKIEKENL
tara:strand:+ start:175 stop:588 length:414 start_codon:yes stop_codon:yes gene_type:complete